ncbi:copper resistance protein CopB, partial [Defluviimonas sp. 20V17]
GVPPTVWSFRTEKLEYRLGKKENSLAWDFDARVGGDEYRLVWKSEGLRILGGGFAELNNELRFQKPISAFFDTFVGVAASTPDGEPQRYYGSLGVTGLAPQWFEVEGALYVSKFPYIRARADYRALITNRLILTPEVVLTMPLADDPARGIAAGGASAELGLRLGYDLIDRSVAPYIGLNYKRSFGGTAKLVRASGGSVGELTGVLGVNFFF